MNNPKYLTQWQDLISGCVGWLLKRRGLMPYLLLARGSRGWGFFVDHFGFLRTSRSSPGASTSGTRSRGPGNYSTAVTDYRSQFIRSIEYAGIATLLALALSYPVAYWIAFRGGRWKNLLLLMIVAPFFVTYLIRTLAWETILSDHGIVVRTLQHLHLVSPGGHLLATATAVVAGITYNFLPFMALPLYVSLEQIDQRFDRGGAGSVREHVKFLRVTLPLPSGCRRRHALTFIPASATSSTRSFSAPENHMIGNVIQSKFLERTDHRPRRRVVHPHGGDPRRDRRLRTAGRHRELTGTVV